MFGLEITNTTHNFPNPHCKKDLFTSRPSFPIENRENQLQVKRQSKPEIPLQKTEGKLDRLESWDEEVKGNPQFTVEYVESIFAGLKLQEAENSVNPQYILLQKELNGKMRAILIDWLIDVHMKFKLTAETLFLSVSLLDRYLTKHQIQREKFQLLGICCLFLASKYEDIYPPDLKECLFVTENSYTKDEMLKLEGELLNAVDFQIKVPTPLVFLERYLRILNAEKRMVFLSRYLLELALIDYKFLKYTASHLAASALYLSGKILKKNFWSENLGKESSFKEEEIRICAKELCFSLQNSNSSILQGVRRKFASSDYDYISKIQLDRLFNK